MIYYILTFIFMCVGYVIFYFFKNKYLNIGFIFLTSWILTTILKNMYEKNFRDNIEEQFSKIDIQVFQNKDKLDIYQILDKFKNIFKDNQSNIKTQVKISAKVYKECSDLSLISTESLAETEMITSYVNTANLKTTEQLNMLRDTDNIVNKVFSSLSNINKSLREKIRSISNAINLAHEGIKSVEDIETRIYSSKKLTDKTSSKIIKLKNYAEKVKDLIKLINSISRQTNMLSLNATIEAARAGEYGKGFSVVASEIGKLSMETEKVSKKVEEVILTLGEEINSIIESMEKEISHMNENCVVIDKTNKHLKNIILTLNEGEIALSEIEDIASGSNVYIEEIVSNINKITLFSKEIALQMSDTAKQMIKQKDKAKVLHNSVENIKTSVYDMQELVAGDIMENKMLEKAYYIRNCLQDKDDIDLKTIEDLTMKTQIDKLNITDIGGNIIFSNDKNAIGLNLYDVNKDLLALKNEAEEYVATPIKEIVQKEGKLFKFLTIIDDNGRLYEIGLSLDTLISEFNK